MTTKKLIKAGIISALAVLTASASCVTAFAEGGPIYTQSVIKTDSQRIFNEWVSYPDKSFGYAYDARWIYNSVEDYINTTDNVGWTGFYNPDITDFSTGEFSFDMLSEDWYPSGFTWGMQKSGTDDNPVYSFYAYEECEDSDRWSVSYIESWSPAVSPKPHQGPVYHATIDASDDYYEHLGDNGTVGFAKGTVLAFGYLPSEAYKTRHNVKINVEESGVSIKINDAELATVAAPVQQGSFGPYACSNPDAYFSDLSFTSTDVTIINAEFAYVNGKGEVISEAGLNSDVSVLDLSSFEDSPIVDRLWTVTKDGELVYCESEPYSLYTKEPGKYTTTLQVVNEQGIKSNIYSADLLVTDVPATTAPAPSEPATSKTATPDTPATQETTVVSNKTIATSDMGAGVIVALAVASAGVVLVSVAKKKKYK